MTYYIVCDIIKEMKYEVELYDKGENNVPVLDFILSLNPKQIAKIYREIDF